MKKVLLTTALVVFLLLTFSSNAFAELPGTGWWSAMFAQNISNGDGTMTMSAYDSTSTSVYSSNTYTFDHGTALIYDPGKTPNYVSGGSFIGFQDNLPVGFEGSVVLSSDIPLVAVSEIANYNNGPVGGGGTASAMYQAMSADMARNKLWVTTIKHNYSHQSTTIYVQAAGSDAHVTITYDMNDGNFYTQTVDIPTNEMFVFDPANASDGGVPSVDCGVDPNLSPCFGAATIESTTGPIVATYVEHPHQGSPAALALSTRAQIVDDQSTILYGPSVKNTYTTGSGTGITGDAIMNVGNAPALVQITLKVTKLGTNAPSWVNVGDIFTDTEVIEPGKSVVFSKWDDNLGGMPEGTYAAAVYESIDTDEYDPQPLLGASNDAKTLSNLPGGKGKTVYKLFAASTLTSRVAVPMVTEFQDELTGALTVQNVGTITDTIHFEFYEYNSSNVYEFWTVEPLPPDEAINSWGVSLNSGGYFANNGSWDFSELSGKQFSAIVYSEGGQPINCLVFENSPAGFFDIRNYEAFSIAP